MQDTRYKAFKAKTLVSASKLVGIDIKVAKNGTCFLT